MQANPINIYVVDDDTGHTRLIEKNLRRSGIGNRIEIFSSGADVLERMHNEEFAENIRQLGLVFQIVETPAIS